MHPAALGQLLLLLGVANGAPVVAKKLFGRVGMWPLDGGARFADGRPVLGPSKTWRGVLASLAATSAAAPLVGLSPGIGAVVGATAMAGDLLSSFLKRRLGRVSSSRATGLDQIPEALFPLLACRAALALSAADIAAGVVLFFVGEVVLSRLFYRLGLRDRPY
ncbi:MAG: CDP-archaeol synthase [Thiohalocapsa sp.]